MLRKSIITAATAGVVSLLFALVPAVASATTPPTSGTTTVTGTVVAGYLTLTPTATESWTTTLTTTGNTDPTYSDPIATSDNTGSGAGWNETITSTDYVGTSGLALTSGKETTGGNTGSTGNAFLLGADQTVDTGGANNDVGSYSLTTLDSVGITSGSGSNTAPTNSVTAPLAVPQAAAAPTAVPFYNAAVGTGMGNFTVTPSFDVTVPANAYAGTYQSVVTLAIVSGP